MDLTSTAVTHGGEIPRQYTCEGENIAPPLVWSDVSRYLKVAIGIHNIA